jgi:hypothetical protein
METTKRKKTGGRQRMFDPVKAVKCIVFVPENDVEMSMAVARAAVQRRFTKLKGKEAGNE